MAGVTGVSSDVKAFLGTDLSNELQRLEPPKGKLGARIIQTIQNEVNRLVNLFKTGHFSTSSQVSARVDKEVIKLTKMMEKEDQIMSKKGTDLDFVDQDLKLRLFVRGMATKMVDIMHKIDAKGGKHSKEYVKLEKDLEKLREINEKGIEHDKQIRQGFEKLGARPEVAPRGRVQVSEAVGELGKEQYAFGKTEALTVARDLQELTSLLRKHKGLEEHLSTKEKEQLKSLVHEKLIQMDPEKVRQTAKTLLPILKKAMFERTVAKGPFDPGIEMIFRSIEKAVTGMKRNVQDEVPARPREQRVRDREVAETIEWETPTSSPTEERERARGMMREIKETGKVPAHGRLTERVDVDRAREAVIGKLPKLVQTLEKHGIKISEHVDEFERKLLTEVATGKTLKGYTSEQLSTIVEDAIDAIGHGYTTSEVGPGHVPDDVKKDIEALKTARQILAAVRDEQIASREQMAKGVAAKEAKAAGEIKEHVERKTRFKERIGEGEKMFETLKATKMAAKERSAALKDMRRDMPKLIKAALEYRDWETSSQPLHEHLSRDEIETLEQLIKAPWDKVPDDRLLRNAGLVAEFLDRGLSGFAAQDFPLAETFESLKDNLSRL